VLRERCTVQPVVKKITAFSRPGIAAVTSPFTGSYGEAGTVVRLTAGTLGTQGMSGTICRYNFTKVPPSGIFTGQQSIILKKKWTANYTI
jgi:hypothetical protein